MARWADALGRALGWPTGSRPRVYSIDRDGVRTLHIGSSVVQSAMRLGDPFYLELSYTRAMMGALLFVPRPERCVLVGLGGGALARYLHQRLPQAEIVAVEIDADVVAVAREQFSLPEGSARFRVEVADGAAWIAARPAIGDAIFVDAFDGREPAAACTSRDFFAHLRTALASPGVAAVNFWDTHAGYAGCRDRLLDAFDGRVALLPSKRPGNVVAFALKGLPEGLRWRDLEVTAASLERIHPLEFTTFVEGLRRLNAYDAERLRV